MMTRYQFHLFGKVQFDPALPVSGRNQQRLLVFLLLAPRQTHTREELVENLWPEGETARGRRTLSDTLYRIRQILPEAWLTVQDDFITFTPGDALWVDIWAFSELTANEDSNDWDQAARLYAGDLAPEIHEVWIWRPREMFREQIMGLLLKLAERAEQRLQFESAFTYYQRLAEIDPMNETAQCGLMRCLAAQQQTEAALTVYHQFQTFLAQELNVPPGEEVQRLAQQLTAEWEVQQQQVGKITTLPLVGRMLERAQLLAALDEAYAGQGGVVILLGEAGIGKSRLLTFLAQAADWRGWQVARGIGEEYALPQPYAPLAAALTTVLPRPRLQQLTRLVPAWWLALAARVIPRLNQELDLPTVPDVPRLERQLSLAMRSLLEGLQQISPHLLLLDDVQWADPALWPLLSELHDSLTEMAVLLVISGRYGHLQNQPEAWQVLKAWEEAGTRVIRLEGLPPQALSELVRSTGHGVLTTDQLARLHQLSSGNPLLALSLLEDDTPVTAVAEDHLLTLQRRRLAQLDNAARLALQAAAVLGYRFDYRLWEMVVTAIADTDLPNLAGELERRRLLILDTEGYRFQHDSLRATVYQDIPADRRPVLHQRALTAYEALRPDETLALLYHAQAAGVETAVARYALQAGQAALARFAYQEAAGYFSEALGFMPETELEARYQACLGKVKAKTLLVDMTDLEEDLALLQTVTRQLDHDPYQMQVSKYLAEFAWNKGDQTQARQYAEQSLALAHRLGDAAHEAALWETLARIARNQGDFHEAGVWIRQANGYYNEIKDDLGAASTLDKLGNLAFEAGEHAKAIDLHRQASDIFQKYGASLQQSRSLSGEALALRGIGQYDQARQIHKRILALARDMDDQYTQWVQMVILGNVALELGDFAAAITWYQEALILCRSLANPRDLSMNLNNLGEAYRERGEPATALEYYEEGLQINQNKGYERGAGHSLHGLGLAWLNLRQPETARSYFNQARVIWESLGERLKLTETLSALARVDLAENELPAALRHIQRALAPLDDEQDHPFWRRWAHYAAYLVYAAHQEPEPALRHLCRAAAAVAEIASKLPPAAKEDFLAWVPVNREIQQAVTDHSESVRVSLVKADVPLGQKLTDADYVTITWTVASPLDQMTAEGPERRQLILKRLLLEAAEQGAAPTDSDLARQLQVSRRTILRDMRALAQKGVVLPTRRR